MVLLRFNTILLFLALALTSYAQNTKDIEKSLIKSYNLEAELKYSAAADALLTNYLEDHYIINLRLGWLYYNAQNYSKSIQYYTKATALMPYAIEPKFGLTLPLSATNKWDEVLAQYEAILSIDAKNSKALFNGALIHYNRGEFNESYPLFKELNNLYPTDYDATHMHGWAALKTGKIREATVIFKTLLLLYPEDESVLSALELLK